MNGTPRRHCELLLSYDGILDMDMDVHMDMDMDMDMDMSIDGHATAGYMSGMHTSFPVIWRGINTKTWPCNRTRHSGTHIFMLRSNEASICVLGLHAEKQRSLLWAPPTSQSLGVSSKLLSVGTVRSVLHFFIDVQFSSNGRLCLRSSVLVGFNLMVNRRRR